MKINYLVSILSIAIGCFLLYIPSLFFDFAWLDQFEILEKGLIASSFSEWWQMLIHDDGNFVSYHRPLYNLIHSLDHVIWSDNAFGYHLSNVVLHTFNILLLGWLLKRLNVNQLIALSLLVAWAMLPLNAAVVALIHAKGDLLSTFFVLIGLHFLITRKSWTLIFYSMAMCLALLSKEVALSGLALSGLWLWREGRLLKWKEAVAISLPIILFAFNQFYVASHVDNSFDFVRLATFPLVYGSYFFESVPGVRLTVSDATWAISARSIQDVVIYGSMFLAAVVLQILIWIRVPGSRPFILLFNLYLLPVSQVVPTLHFRADRFLYAASIGWLGMFITALYDVMQNRRIPLVLSVIVALFFLFKTLVYLPVFKDDRTLFSYTHLVDSDCREANAFLGKIAMTDQDYAKAQEYFTQSLNGNPLLYSFVDRDGVKANLGTIAMRSGEYDRALSLFESIEGGTDKYPEMNLNIAICHKLALRPRKAYEYLVIYQKKFPDELKGMEKMAEVYVDLGRKQKAIDELNRILKLYPEHPNRAVMNDAIELLRQSDY